MSEPRRSTEKLTKLKVENYVALDGRQTFYWDMELRGFGVGITPGGTRTYVAQARVNGKTVRVKIGVHGRWTCDEARRSARDTLIAMDKGVDPRAEERKQKAQGVTLSDLAADYKLNKKTKHGSLTDRTKQDIDRHVTKSFAAWADKPVRLIDAAACKKRFADMSKVGPTQANQAFRVLRGLLNYARKTSKGADGVATLLVENPVTAITDGSMWNSEKPREERIPFEKVGAVWACLQALRTASKQTRAGRTAADYVCFLMLCGARRSEACELTWDRVNLTENAGTWHLAVSKNHKPITRPLSETARKMLFERFESRDEENPFVFPGRFGEGHFDGQAISVFKKISAIAGVHLSSHSMRRVIADAAEEAGFEHKVDHLLAHTPAGVTERHYANNRDPRKLMPSVEAIAAYYADQAAKSNGQNIVQIRA